MEERYKQTFETWNQLAFQYQEQFMDLDLYNDSYDVICNAISQADAKILEIGCGPGNITKYLLSKRPDFDILGIDVAPQMIELAKINNPDARFEVMDCREIDKIATTYDGLVCGFCLPYLSPKDCEKFIADCAVLLNENGLIYLSFVEGNPGNSGFQTTNNGLRSYFNFYRLEDLVDQLKTHTFDEIQVMKVEYKKDENTTEMHTILTARKRTRV